MELYKNLDLGFRLSNNGACEVCVTEPESGIHKTFEFYYMSDGIHPDFDDDLGREVYSWLSLWIDSLEDEEDEEEEDY